ncbi:hypothetical protein BTA51_27165 [Hahella sp. CCB-MM4]|uniref:hypothetical protein n=1 Tax=Hahella sp. (strain CCB-MM4) TaxID=1926491 RepID=UPI000B9B2DDC|nr:hypothetical protein [Hahella sp. CCB-MM4]OZG70158.1 hypothetical protein BTA51_27165 [Hahella sp. CCB-MM4]
MKAEEMLPDNQNTVEINGVTIRKGSVGAFLASARVLSDSRVSESDRVMARRDIVELLPGLRAMGLFEVFQVRNEQLRALVESC